MEGSSAIPSDEPAKPVSDFSQRLEATETEERKPAPTKETQSPGTDVPGWLERTTYGATLQTHQDPQFNVETVQPLFQTLDQEHTLFTQARASMFSGGGNYSAGWGYRNWNPESNIILGINNFFDYREPYQHYRTGVGVEALGADLEFRANSYFGLSPTREVRDEGRVVTYEKAVKGVEIEIGGNPAALDWLMENLGDTPPESPRWLKLFGGISWYNYHNGADQLGWKVRGEVKPFRGLAMNLAALSDSQSHAQYQADVRLSLAVTNFLPKSIMESVKEASIPATKPPDLSTHVLDRVEREYNVRVERWTFERWPAPPPVIVGNLANVQLVIRFPGVNPVTTDFNGNGFVDAGESFELDVRMTNTSDQPSTGIGYANAVASSPGFSWSNNSAILPDAPAGEITITDNNTDLDIDVDPGASPGDSFTVTMNFTADGETVELTFGPFTVGSMYHDQVIDIVN